MKTRATGSAAARRGSWNGAHCANSRSPRLWQAAALGLVVFALVAGSGAHAGSFVFAGRDDANVILHPHGYLQSPFLPTALEVGVCVDPTVFAVVTTPAEQAALEQSVRNVVRTWNGLAPATGNLSLPAPDVGAAQFDWESVALHEVGHCIGLAHPHLGSESGLLGTQVDYARSTDANGLGVHFVSCGPGTTPLISEYLEGTGSNQALEIYNPTASALSLTGWRIRRYANGSATPTSDFLIPSGGVFLLDPGESLVIANSAASAAVLALADFTTSDTAFQFDGDDAIALVNPGLALVDVIGQIGTDPGTEWGAALTSTADNTLRRNPAVCTGDSNGGDAFNPATQWTGFATDNLVAFDLDDGVDNVIGSRDDVRGNDVNLLWYRYSGLAGELNNPFTIAPTVDQSSYRRTAPYPGGDLYAEVGNRNVAGLRGVAGSEAVMVQGTFPDEAQRILGHDDVATLRLAMTGRDLTVGGGDDYTVRLVYRGVTAGCEIPISFDDTRTAFASCALSGLPTETNLTPVFASHLRVASSRVFFNTGFNWFYNPTSNGGAGGETPIAVDDAYAGTPGATLVVAAPGVLGNDSDPDDGLPNLSALLVDGPGHAAAFSLLADGSFSYTPQPSWGRDGRQSGSDTFSYRVEDTDGNLSNLATVTVAFGVHGAGVDNVSFEVELSAQDVDYADRFGHMVALSGTTMLVGAPNNGDQGGGGQTGNASGTAYIFELLAGRWQQVRKIDAAPDIGASFGEAVDLDGDVAVVGGDSSGPPGADTSAAYVFYRHLGGTNAWGRQKKLDSTLHRFGSAVAVGGDHIAVGSNDGDPVSLYGRNVGGVDNWGLIKTFPGLSSSTAREQLDLDGNFLLIGTRLYERNFGGVDNWGLRKTFVQTGPMSAALDGTTVALGNFNHATPVLVFEKDSGGADNWGQVAALAFFDVATGRASSLALDGDVLVAGYDFDDPVTDPSDWGGTPYNDGVFSNGSLYVFHRNEGGPGAWGLVQKAYHDGGGEVPLLTQDGLRLGSTVAVSGPWLATGSPSRDVTLGSQTAPGGGSASLFRMVSYASSADLELASLTDTPDPVISGQTLLYTLTLGNAGPNAANTVTFQLDDFGTNSTLGSSVPSPTGFATRPGAVFALDFGAATCTNLTTMAVAAVTHLAPTFPGRYQLSDPLPAGQQVECEVSTVTSGGPTRLIHVVGEVWSATPEAFPDDEFELESTLLLSPDGIPEIEIETEDPGAPAPPPGAVDELLHPVDAHTTLAVPNVVAPKRAGYAVAVANGDPNGGSPADAYGRAIVGAFGSADDRIAPASCPLGNIDECLVGSAYIYENPTLNSDLTSWDPKTVLDNPTPQLGDLFGVDVDIALDPSGAGVDRAIVGAPQCNSAHDCPAAGKAFIYERVAGTWTLVESLPTGAGGEADVNCEPRAPAVSGCAGDAYGHSVAITGNFAVVGAYRNENVGAAPCTGISDPNRIPHCNTGSAYVYERTGPGVWVFRAKLEAPVKEVNDNFGLSVGIDDGSPQGAGGVTVVVGAHQCNIEGGSLTGVDLTCQNIGGGVGKAYVFERNAGGVANSWGIAESFDNDTISDFPGSKVDEMFGWAVAVDADDGHLVIAAPEHCRNNSIAECNPLSSASSLDNQGAVYLYERNGGNPDQWDLLREIAPRPGVIARRHGESVAVENGYVTIGTIGHQRLGGGTEVNIYEEAVGFIRTAALLPTDLDSGDLFGVGSQNAVDLSGFGSGAGARFAALGGSFAHEDHVTAANCPPGFECRGSAYLFNTGTTPRTDLRVAKAALTSPAIAGNNLTYQITVTNDGPSTALVVQSFDTIPVGTTFVSSAGCGNSGQPTEFQSGVHTCNLPSQILSGGNLVYTVTVAVPPDRTPVASCPNALCLLNSVTVEGFPADGDLADNTAAIQTPVAAQSALTLTKVPSGTNVVAGGQIVYTITATNNGPSNLLGLVVNDSFSLGGAHVTLASSVGCGNDPTGFPSCNLGNLTVGQQVVYTLTFDISPAAPFTFLTNTATASASSILIPATPTTGAVMNTIVRNTNLTVTKTDGPDPIAPGELLTYTVNVHNAGPSETGTVVVDDPAPAGLTFQSSTGCTESPAGGEPTCTIANIAVGGNAVVTYTYLVPIGYAGADPISNTASVTIPACPASPRCDPTPGGESDTETTDVVPKADLSVGKQVDTVRPEVGDSVTFTVSVENDGPSTGTGIELTDLLPSGLTYQSHVAFQGSYTPGTGVWAVGTLAPETNATLDITALVAPGPGDPGGSGAFVDVFAVDTGAPTPPSLVGATGLTFGADGNLYVASPGSNEVLRFDGDLPSTAALAFASGGGLLEPQGIAFGPDRNLYVASRGSDQILRFDGTTLAFIDVFAATAGAPLLDAPTGILFADGDLYVASEGTNQIFRFDGTAPSTSGTVFASGGGLLQPWGLAFGPDGNLYVASRGSDEVLRYDGGSGAFIDAFILLAGGLADPRGLVFSSEESLFVTSVDGGGADDVRRYVASTGVLIGTYASGGGLEDPHGVALGPDGNLYVASDDSGQVLRFDGFLTNLAEATALAAGEVDPDGTDDVAAQAIDFARLDFGDAPDPTYPTLRASAGARHVVPPGGATLFLGATAPDVDADGQPSALADGDDNNGIDDEDGVAFPELVRNQMANLSITASAPGVLNAWIDFDQDGVFEAGLPEQIAVDLAVVAGANPLVVNVPAGAPLGNTYARLRLSSATGTLPNGRADDGEVEDYRVGVFDPPALTVAKSDGAITATPGSTIPYTITVANGPGLATATGITLTETVPANTTFNVGASAAWVCLPDGNAGSTCTLAVANLSAGASATPVFAVDVVNPVPAGTTQISNTVTLTASNAAGGNASDTTPVTADPNLALTKSDGGGSTTPGAVVIYTLTVTNNGNEGATAVVLTETVPVGTSFAAGSSTPGWVCVPDNTAGSTCTFNVAADIAGGGGSTMVLFAVQVANPVVANYTEVSNAASVVAGNAPTPVNANDTTPVTADPALALTKTDGGVSTVPGGTVTYTLEVTNSGNENATGVTFTDTVPANSTFLPGASTVGWSCLPDSNAGSVCTLALGADVVGGGGTANATFAVQVANPLPAGVDQLTNNASVVAANATSPVNANDTTPIDATPDLAITKDDGGAIAQAATVLMYTLTVDNNGNQDATGVVITETVPANATFDDPATTAVWVCLPDANAGSTCTHAVGALAAGASVMVDFAVLIDAVLPPATDITNTASVADDGANGVDPTPGDNSDTIITSTDETPPQVERVDAVAASPAGEVTECEELRINVSAFEVVFDEEMADPPGDGAANDVTNPANYRVIGAGANSRLETTSCGAPVGDDVVFAITAATWDEPSLMVSLDLAVGSLASGSYRIFACPTLTDVASNPLDGNGDATGGDAFVRTFRSELENRFVNGHLDCNLDSWNRFGGNPLVEITHTTAVDVDAAPQSGSAAFANTSGVAQLAMRQCVDTPAVATYELATRFRKNTAPDLVVTARCEHFVGFGCTGTPTTLSSGSTVVVGGVGLWQPFSAMVPVPAGTGSSRCGIELTSPGAVPFSANLDRLSLRFAGDIFADGFESGSTSAWDGTVDENAALLAEITRLTDSDAAATAVAEATDAVASPSSATEDPTRTWELASGNTLALRPIANRAVASPEGSAVNLMLDDGSAEGVVGVNSGGFAQQFLWFNQYPVPSLFRLEEVAVLFPSASGPVIGDTIEIVVYHDPDADPTTGATLLYNQIVTVQAVDGVTFSVYPLLTPVVIPAGGDVLIGVINRYVVSGVTPATDFPAALDTTSSAARSWFATWTGDPPNPAAFPPTGDLELVDTFQPGNWLIRGSGQPLDVVEIPSLDGAGLVLLALLLLGCGWRLRRRNTVAGAK